MSMFMIQAKIKPEYTTEIEAVVTKMFTAIEAAKPEGVRYLSSRLADGETYVVLLEVADETENPLTKVPEFLEFQGNLRNWLAGPPEQFTVVGQYGFSG